MAVQITIIGLGQIGASMGLALAKIKDQAVRVGNDREPAVARQAEKIGAVDRTHINLPTAVREADIVILALPPDEVRKTIEVIAQDLKPGSLLIDTSASASAAMSWAEELLPGKDRYFITLTPSINPLYLSNSAQEPAEAHADLFQNSLMLISSPAGIDESALDLAVNLVTVFGATPLFTDPSEADGLMASSSVLPRLVSAALVNALGDQPGWREARKMAGNVYAQVTQPVIENEGSASISSTALLNAENTVRLIDQMIDELRTIRDAVADQDEDALQNRMNRAHKLRSEWWRLRLSGEWEPKTGSNAHIPSGGEVIGRLFGLRSRKEPKSR